MKIYIARHGQDQDNQQGILNGRRDTPLTELGIMQARELALEIQRQGLHIQKIYSSPLQRAHATAIMVAQTLGLDDPEKSGLLLERDFGIMTGTPVKDIEATCSPGILKANPIVYFLSPEGAETFPELFQRAQEVLAWLRQSEQPEEILLVTHGDIGKMIYAAFYGETWDFVLTKFHLGNSELLCLEQGLPDEKRHLHKTQQDNH